MAMYPIEACDLDLGKVVVGDDIYIHIRTANGEVAVVDLRVDIVEEHELLHERTIVATRPIAGSIRQYFTLKHYYDDDSKDLWSAKDLNLMPIPTDQPPGNGRPFHLLKEYYFCLLHTEI